MKKTIMTALCLLLCAAAVIWGCATRKSAVSTIPGGVKTFSMYGFSFRYPADFSMVQLGGPGEEADEQSGVVIVSREYTGSKFWAYQVTWFEIASTCNKKILEGNIEAALDGLESTEGIISVESGEIVQSVKGEEPMFFRHYSSTSVEGEKVYGIVSSFYCRENSKVIAVMTMRGGSVSAEEILQDFMVFMDSFSCY